LFVIHKIEISIKKKETKKKVVIIVVFYVKMISANLKVGVALWL